VLLLLLLLRILRILRVLLGLSLTVVVMELLVEYRGMREVQRYVRDVLRLIHHTWLTRGAKLLLRPRRGGRAVVRPQRM